MRKGLASGCSSEVALTVEFVEFAIVEFPSSDLDTMVSLNSVSFKIGGDANAKDEGFAGGGGLISSVTGVVSLMRSSGYANVSLSSRSNSVCSSSENIGGSEDSTIVVFGVGVAGAAASEAFTTWGAVLSAGASSCATALYLLVESGIEDATIKNPIDNTAQITASFLKGLDIDCSGNDNI